ncbi:DUF4064 domain-containing protein [Niallia taxi]|uniref:DUF4064 domain-containing protein n=1 Tax=Niallia taxi TaxID=2499688 RepID=UPI0021A7E86D|nr:DUF4064 domain-containing protein [Niallia taxi]MCT2347673.1 DUF4064 domain-containing protein [Niallia taxi]
MGLNLKAPKILGVVSLVLLVIGFIISLVFYTQIDKQAFIRDAFIEAYNADPVYQESLGLTNLPDTPEAYADEMIVTGKNLLLIPVITSLLACAATLFSTIAMNKLPRTSAVLFIIVGVANLLTVIIPILLITGGIMILNRRSKYNKEAGIPA